MGDQNNPRNVKPISLAPLSVEEALGKAMNVRPSKGQPGKLQAVCSACGHTNMVDDEGGTEPAWIHAECGGCGKRRKFHVNPMNDSDGGKPQNVYRTAIDKTG